MPPANDPLVEPPLPGEFAPDAAANPVSSTAPVNWTSTTEVVMRLNAEQLRELDADGELRLQPPELKASQILAQLEQRQPSIYAPKFDPLQDEQRRKRVDSVDEAIPREPWQFSLQEMMWVSVIMLVGVAFTRLLVKHPAFLTLGILAWCGIFVLGRLHFRDPERISWVAVQAMGFTYILILWIGWSF